MTPVSTAYVIRSRRPGETACYVVEAGSAKPSWFARQVRGTRSVAHVHWSVNLDDARRFPTAGLAESYIERVFGTADGYDIVRLIP